MERKRRDNISEGINQIGKLVPGCTEKMGKGQVLKLAAQYLSEVAVKVGDLGGIDKVRPEIEADKLQVRFVPNFYSPNVVGEAVVVLIK